jgi:hypothetical protein
LGYELVDWCFHFQLVFQWLERRVEQNLVPPDISSRLISDEQYERAVLDGSLHVNLQPDFRLLFDWRLFGTLRNFFLAFLNENGIMSQLHHLISRNDLNVVWGSVIDFGEKLFWRDEALLCLGCSFLLCPLDYRLDDPFGL